MVKKKPKQAEKEMAGDFQKKIYGYALKNAIAHEGKAKVEAVISALFQEGLKKEDIVGVMPDAKKIIENVNSLNVEEQEKKFQQLQIFVKEREKRGGLLELPNAIEGKVIMRIAPYPSGPLHIGNTRQLVLNDYYVNRYNGKLFLIFDDTIGSEEKQIAKEAYKLIEEGIKWLGVKYEKPIIYKSDRLEIYYKYAKQLIEKGNAYVCSCDTETLRQNRAKGVECACRQYSVDKQLERWKKMFKAKQGKFTLRLKTSMQHPNPAFRDRVLFRISEREHPRVGNKYKVWPLLEFSWAIDDHLLGSTHIIRGKELMMESEMQKFIWDIFGWKHPVLIHTGLFQIAGAKISKSKGQQEVKAGRYKGWDDPRTWSLQSLEKRGIQAEAIKDFCLSLGLTQTEITVPIDVLYKENRKLLEKCKRLFFVAEPKKIYVNDAPSISAEIPLHPNIDLGKRKVAAKGEFFVSRQDFRQIEQGGNFRLMYLFNFRASRTPLTQEMKIEFISKEPQESLNAKPLQWLVADKKNEKQLVKTNIVTPDGNVISGLAEEYVRNLKKGEIVQFERFGFCKLNDINKKTGEYEFWFAHR